MTQHVINDHVIQYHVNLASWTPASPGNDRFRDGEIQINTPPSAIISPPPAHPPSMRRAWRRLPICSFKLSTAPFSSHCHRDFIHTPLQYGRSVVMAPGHAQI